MKLIHLDYKKGTVKVKLDTSEDAWHLSKLIKEKDKVYGRTERKIKLSGSEEKSSVIKKTIWLSVDVEKISLEGSELRINGLVQEGFEDIPKGSHQSIALGIGDETIITKQVWSFIDKERLTRAVEERPLNLMAVVFDREEAYLAQLTQRGFQIITHEKGDVARKDYAEEKGSFFSTLSRKIEDIAKNIKPTKIILASPAFWKEYLLKELPESIKDKAVLATVSSVDETSFTELNRRPELQETLAKDRTLQEEGELEEFFKDVRNDLGCYGVRDLEEGAATGNLKKVVVSEEALTASGPRAGSLGKNATTNKEWVEKFLGDAEAVGAEILIISKDAAQQKLQAFGGVLGIKRWKTS